MILMLCYHPPINNSQKIICRAKIPQSARQQDICVFRFIMPLGLRVCKKMENASFLLVPRQCMYIQKQKYGKILRFQIKKPLFFLLKRPNEPTQLERKLKGTEMGRNQTNLMGQMIMQGYKEFIIIISFCMNCVRELPPEYLENCPVIDSRYKVLFKLGSGRFSKVRMAIDLATNQRVALKIMNEKETEGMRVKSYCPKILKSFLDQIQMCTKARHRSIIQITDFQVGGVYRSPDGSARRILYYVMKFASYGELHRLIKNSEIFTEKLARIIFQKLILTVEHLHNSRISHRDIKSQNILIDHKFNIQLVDFGCASYFVDYQHKKIDLDCSEPVGTLKSNAPELTNHLEKGTYHGDEIDLFACGCVLFEMVVKAEPFKSTDHTDKNYGELSKGNYEKFWHIFSSICKPSPQFKDLIQMLFDPNPKTRISMEGVKQHPWFTGELPKRNQFKKEMRVRLKKVGAKIRKQQEEQIKSFFKQERSKMQCGEVAEIIINRGFQTQILALREMLASQDSSDSSSCTSSADAKQFEQKQKAARNLLHHQ